MFTFLSMTRISFKNYQGQSCLNVTVFGFLYICIIRERTNWIKELSICIKELSYSITELSNSVKDK